VNRRGFGNETEVIVLDPPSGEKSPLAVAERLDAVRALLARLPCHRDRPEARDASPGSLLTLYHAARKDPELAHTIERASTPDPLYPPLDRPTLEAWSMTSLPDDPGRPAVAPWLRGWVEDRPQTSITWRKYLPLTDGSRPRDSIAKRFFQAAPAHLSEVLETESTRVADWLGKRANKLRALDRKTAKDAVGLGDEDHVLVVHRRNDEAFDWFTLRRLDSLSRRELDRKLTAAEVFVDARFGGLSTSGMLDASCDGSPPTADDGAWDAAGFRVREVEDESPIEDPVWRERERFPRDKDDEGEVRRWLVVEKRLIETATEEDRSAGRPQPLSNHQQCAKKHADRIVEGLGLCPSMRRLLPIAARLHDEGKRAKRWQAAFRAPKDGRPFAKTLGPVNPHLLDGYRHEFGSLPYAERDPEVAALPSEDRDLVLHLIACHHGYARPVISTGGCDDAPPSALRERARDVALRFAWLQARWGPWGLAYWEALLRASDQGASRENDRADTRGRAEKA
jgi:CRISPR-associated endonuclease/helicase Cas3